MVVAVAPSPSPFLQRCLFPSFSRARAHYIFLIFNITISHTLIISELPCDIDDISDVDRSNNCIHSFRWEVRVERAALSGVFHALEQFVPWLRTSRSMRGNDPKVPFGRTTQWKREKLLCAMKKECRRFLLCSALINRSSQYN